MMVTVYAGHVPVDLDHDSPEPLYRQVADDLKRRIAADGLTRLPSLLTIQQEYDVSRPTAESAVKILADEGIVRVSPGKGTFVIRLPELCARALRQAPARPLLDASGCVQIRPGQSGCVRVASPGMETEDDDEPPRRVRLSNAEWAYAQVADDIGRRIRAGEFPYEAKLPSREDLAAEYGVGQMTVRHALRVLAGRGMVRPMPSRGTIVVWTGHEEGTPEPPRTHGNPR